ncbi:helix-turn-helix domain-containing protein [Amphritea sp. 1_MG-2023]|uniref:helix-turn-helix domain-containing protein n=1 Tax=Amphritea sp. 1_MG-2023 TaxID=3062670 RepID=UPI0026E1EE53|nr:helix-turn-helix domain-containing protein [Amphritea sp. 1_MG-2023]MDO6562205.1 helix-turn-helix domain-containing protein [Amphritea sp. 1_MG-2023]
MNTLNRTFARRLFISYLIATTERPSVPALIALTGWPRRTIQDVIKVIPGMGVNIYFKQDGRRNNDGYYVIDSWGAINSEWVKLNIDRIKRSLELK